MVFWNVARLTNKDEEFYLWEKIKQWDKTVAKPNTTRHLQEDPLRDGTRAGHRPRRMLDTHKT